MHTPLFTTELPQDLVSLSDYERYAHGHLPASTLEYLSSGVADDITLGRNRHAFDQLALIGTPAAAAPCAVAHSPSGWASC